MKYLAILLTFSTFCMELYGHGRSEELTKIFNEPVPEWMQLAEPIRVTPSEGNVKNIDPAQFRNKSGGITNTKNRVHIPSKNITQQFDYQIAWRGGSKEGYGSSLNSDEDKVLINRRGKNPDVRLYKITEDNELLELPVQVPNVTYDQGPKGFISLWHWASNDLLIGRATIADEMMHELVESRIYVYSLKTNSLARLDLSALNINTDDPPFVEVVSIKKDLTELVLKIGGTQVLTQVDLKSPHKLLTKEVAEKSPETAE